VNRWIVAILVLLAFIVLVSPGIIGRMAERNIEQNIDWADDQNPAVTVETEKFDRGWFTSEGRHRVVFSGGTLRDASDVYAAFNSHPDLPSLIIDTRIDHGLLPVTSLARDSGSLAPGLANTISTFQLDPGNGELTPLPGTLYSRVGVSGATDSRFLLETGSFSNESLHAEWQGADLNFVTNPATGALSIDGETEPFSIEQDGDKMSVGEMSVDLHQESSDYDINVGTLDLQIGPVTVESAEAPFSIGGMSLTGDTDIDDGRMSGSSVFELQAMSVPGFGDMDMNFDVTIEGLDAKSLGVIATALQEAQAAPDPDIAMQNMLPAVAGDFEALARAGGAIRFDRFDFTLPQGTVEMKLDLDFPEVDDDREFSWSTVLIGMTAAFDMRMPSELYEFAQMMNPEAGSLVAMGILKKDGDFYVMDAEYAQGLLNVNGAPMPVPMPGL